MAISYEQAKSIAISNTISDGKVYYAGDVGSFYIFIVVRKDFPMGLKRPVFGTTFTAVDKKDGRVWDCYINDPRLKGVKKIE